MNLNAPSPIVAADDCIEAVQVSKAFGKRIVLDQISLTVKRGEIFGLLGPSGSGKTTLVRLITGLDVPDNGSITLLDVHMPKLSVLSRIGYMAQSDALYGELTAQENLEFFSSLYGLRGAVLKKRIQEVAELVKLSGDLKKPVQLYSGGMKRRLSLAVALMHKPEVLILDEPTVGIDPVLRKTIWDELDHLRKNGVTILVTTHVMDEAEKCDRLAMIRDGRVIAFGSPEQLKTESHSSTMEDAFITYGGGAA
ncbi:ABC transporter ATP-binding protein [Cohnella silvisoli]|uniref:ABC transporter ATP-binding protein n=1 Tax=Cohnella silvisoli TaxID=2873699 RepID=A0ABV1KYX3_9BACL|nr:ABC transporter ATP-binding protein [Cohnella silvisoli]MCD9024271.1 ABC transporter ATP-binding protein [Cohnella silvisoli]